MRSALEVYREKKQAESERIALERERQNERNRRYYARNRETVLARNADWRERNRNPELDRMARSAYWHSRGKFIDPRRKAQPGVTHEHQD